MKLDITCPEKLDKALQEAREHHDTSLRECIMRLVEHGLRMGYHTQDEEGEYHFHHDEDATVKIFSDFGRDFGFAQIRGDGSVSIRGGLCCHGYPGEPDKSFSVTMDREHVWQLHT